MKEPGDLEAHDKYLCSQRRKYTQGARPIRFDSPRVEVYTSIRFDLKLYIQLVRTNKEIEGAISVRGWVYYRFELLHSDRAQTCVNRRVVGERNFDLRTGRRNSGL